MIRSCSSYSPLPLYTYIPNGEGCINETLHAHSLQYGDGETCQSHTNLPSSGMYSERILLSLVWFRMYRTRLFLTTLLVCRMMSPIDDKLGPWWPKREQDPPKLMWIPQTRMEFDEARVSRRNETIIAPLDKMPMERSIRPLLVLVYESQSRRRGPALQKILVQAALVANPSRRSSRLNLAPKRLSKRNRGADPEPPERNLKALLSNPNNLSQPSVRGPKTPKSMQSPNNLHKKSPEVQPRTSLSAEQHALVPARKTQLPRLRPHPSCLPASSCRK